MRQDKWKDKVRKLLSLAQSDNEFEAERARAQAKKLMKIHAINEDNLLISSVACKTTFNRKQLKLSEAYLAQVIAKISACFPGVESENNNGRWRSKVSFMGYKSDAEMAAYVFDVLSRQLLEKEGEFKKDYLTDPHKIESFRQGWVVGVTDRIQAVFPNREHSEELKAQFGAIPRAKVNTLEKDKDTELLKAIGMSSSEDAKLFVPADSINPKPVRIGSI